MAKAETINTTLTRRAAMGKGALALAAVAIVPACMTIEPAGAADGEGELAALVRRYFEQVDVFNRVAVQDARTDKQNDALARATFEKTIRQIVGVPARTRKDALAALEFLEREEMIEIWVNSAGGLSESLVAAIRGYIEGGVA
jgi:hypothetical protein